MTTLAAHQPQYLPWLGYFDKLAQADVFVLLDDVQFKKNEWQNRNRIKGPGGPQWITVPVHHKFPQTIAEVEVRENEPWRRKHLRALESNYGRAPCFAAQMPLLAEVLERPWSHLAPLNIELVRRLAERLGIDTEILLGSSFATGSPATAKGLYERIDASSRFYRNHRPATAGNLPATGKKSESPREHPTLRLVDLCTALGADTYLSGAGGDYLERERFAEAGIELRFQRYEHPTYAQLHDGFEPYLSIVDLLMNCGVESYSIVRSGRLAPS